MIYCDFVLWTEKDLAIENFFDHHIISAVKHFVRVYGILPEVTGKFYTRKPVANVKNRVIAQTPSTESSKQVTLTPANI